MTSEAMHAIVFGETLVPANVIIEPLHEILVKYHFRAEKFESFVLIVFLVAK